MLGAALEYYRITGEKEQLELAKKIARRAVVELAGEDGIFNYEARMTAVFFRGIYFRYLYELVMAADDCDDLKKIILKNADAVSKAMREDGWVGGDWRSVSAGEIDLAQQFEAV